MGENRVGDERGKAWLLAKSVVLSLPRTPMKYPFSCVRFILSAWFFTCPHCTTRARRSQPGWARIGLSHAQALGFADQTLLPPNLRFNRTSLEDHCAFKLAFMSTLPQTPQQIDYGSEITLHQCYIRVTQTKQLCMFVLCPLVRFPSPTPGAHCTSDDSDYL